MKTLKSLLLCCAALALPALPWLDPMAVEAAVVPFYADPGWNYIYDGSKTQALGVAKAPFALDGTWSADNGSSEWDGSWRGAGNGLPGGISSDGDILTIEDADISTGGSLNNRKIYFEHTLAYEPTLSNPDTIVDSGITISFRARLTQPGIQPAAEIAVPKGWGIFSGGKGMFGVHQLSGGQHTQIAFSLVTTNTLSANGAVNYNFTTPGLTMNRLTTDTVGGAGSDTSSGTAELNQVFPVDPNEFHEFWITIQTNDATTGNGTHTVSIYADGSLTPTVFNVTAGNGNDGESGTNANFIAMGLNNSVGASAMDVDFFAYKQGIIMPAPTDTTSPIGLRFALTNQEVPEGAIVKFSTSVTGAPPYYIQWQRSDGGGGFTNVPGATAASYLLGPVLPSDDASMFLLIASNNFSVVTSSVVTLTVQADLTPPTIVSASGRQTLTNAIVTFSERITPASANNAANYGANNGLSIATATLDATGTRVILTTSAQTPGTAYTLTINNLNDVSVAGNAIATDSTASFTAWVPSRGFLNAELFLNLSGNAIADLTGSPRFPNFPDVAGYVNAASNAQTSPNLEGYGGRLSGWILPPVDGTYTFYIRGDDGTELRLSPSADPEQRGMIAAQTSANQPFTAGASPPQALLAGQRYFLEALWKEGTGGDYVQVAWQTPSSPDIVGIPCESLETLANPDGVSVTLTQQPQGGGAVQNRAVALTVGANILPASLAPLACYQWQKGDGAGGFTNVHALNRPAISTPLLQYPADDGSLWRVIVGVPGGSATSDVATITVTQDLTPPAPVSAASLDGATIGVCFDELLDGNPVGMNSASDNFNYLVDGANPIAVTLRPDGQSVILSLATPVGPTFALNVINVTDRSGNAIGSIDLTGQTLGLSAIDVGTPGLAGSHFVCDSNSIQMVGGGSDIWGNADTNYFVFRGVTGDFDARVRVTSLAGLDSITKGALLVRETTNTDSRTLHLAVNPAGGRNQFEPGQRATTGGATASWGTNVMPANIPDCWLRLTRNADHWSGFFSTNGVDWRLEAETIQTYPATLQVGLGVTAHNNTLLATGTFSNFMVSQIVNRPTIAGLAYSAGSFSGSILTGDGIVYEVQYKSQIQDPQWLRLTTITGDGTVKPFTDPGPAASQRFYRAIIP